MGEPETPSQFKSKYGVWPPGYDKDGNKIENRKFYPALLEIKILKIFDKFALLYASIPLSNMK